MRIRNVSGRSLSLFSSLLVLSGCTGAVDPSVSFLSFSLPSLKSTGSSPFQQELDKTGYLELQGTCDKMVTSFQIQMDQAGWKDIPVLPGIAPPGVALPSRPYDVDCSDGVFSFYLLKDELQSYLPVGGDIASYQPSAIHLRGIAGPFTTIPLTFYDNNANSGQEANDVVLRPLNSRFDVGLCVPVDLQLVYRKSGESWWTGRATNSQDRQVSVSLRNFTTNSVQFYTDRDCQTGLVSTVTIPKGELVKIIYLKGTAPTQGSISVAGVGVGFGGTTFEEHFISILTAGAPVMAGFSEVSRRADVGSCERVSVFLYDQDGVLTSPSMSDLSVVLGKSADVRLYADSDCGGGDLPNDTVTFKAGGRPWIRLSYTVSKTSPNQITIPSGGSLTSQQPSYFYINPWLAAFQAVMTSAYPAGMAYQAPDCVETKVVLTDKNGTPENRIKPGYNFDYTVSTSSGGLIYNNSACVGSGVPIQTMTFESGQLEKTFYWKLDPSSTVTNFRVNGWEEVPPAAPSRLEDSRSAFFELPVVPNLMTLGGAVQQLYRLPRVFQSAPVPLAEIGLIQDLSDPAYASKKLEALYSGSDPSSVYVGKDGGRAIEQQVLDLGGEDGFATSALSTISLTDGYMLAVMFRANMTGTPQVLMGFENQTKDRFVINSGGSVEFMGCTIGSGLSDGRWHTLIVGRRNFNILSGGTVFYQVDDQTVQQCSVSASLISTLGLSFAARFVIGQLDGGPGLNGQIAEILYGPNQGPSTAGDPLFQQIHTHFLNRYPLSPL